jgi:hypothetical protein
MSQAGTPTDNGSAERFVGLFPLAVAECSASHTLGEFLRVAQRRVTFSHTTRPHQSLRYRSPDPFAQEQDVPNTPSLTLLSCLVFRGLDRKSQGYQFTQQVQQRFLLCLAFLTGERSISRGNYDLQQGVHLISNRTDLNQHRRPFTQGGFGASPASAYPLRPLCHIKSA